MSIPGSIQNQRRVKIYFDDEKAEEDGFYQLMMSGMPAVALDNGRYLVNVSQLKILEERNLHPRVENVCTE